MCFKKVCVLVGEIEKTEIIIYFSRLLSVLMIYGAEEVFTPLRAVILAKPDYFNVTTAVLPQQQAWIHNVDLEKAQYQHRQLADQFKQLRITTHYLPTLEGKVDQVFVRDAGAISSRGALLSDFSAEWRKGEERALAALCEQYAIPILNNGKTFSFEGGDFFFLGGGKAILGKGPRTHCENDDLVRVLGLNLIYTVEHQSPHHLDAVFNIVREDLVVVNRKYVDYKAPYFLGKKMIDLDDDDFENLAANYIVLDRGMILADKGSNRLHQQLRKWGMDVIETDVSELKKGGGSIRCMTLPLRRG